MLVDPFLAAGASAAAVLFTNPLDVIKVKCQLQTEAASKSKAFQSLWQLLKASKLQSGLSAAICYQASMNGCRFFVYDTAKAMWNTDGSAALNMLFGCVSGLCGAAVGSPFSLIKTRMQSACLTPGSGVAGDQHGYTSLWHASKRIYLSNRKLLPFWAGARASMLRTGVGSCFQLATYDAARKALLPVTGSASAATVLASLMAGFTNALAVCPFDVATVRLYNQAYGGKYYAGIASCMVKSVTTEGFGSLYRGFAPLFLRMGPHSFLTFLFLERLRAAV